MGARKDNTPDGMMGVTRICSLTGWDRSAIYRFLDFPEVRAWLGGDIQPPFFPLDRLDDFREMLRQQQIGVKPGAFAVQVKQLEVGEALPVVSGVPASAESDMVLSGSRLPDRTPDRMPDTIAGTPISTLSDAAHELGGRFADVVIERVRAAMILPPPEDRCLTREQAAELLACPPRAVGRRVRPISHETWSFLDCQEYIAALREQARTKNATRNAARIAAKGR